MITMIITIMIIISNNSFHDLSFTVTANQSSPMAKDSPSGIADKTSTAGTQIKQDPPSTKTPTGGIDGVPTSKCTNILTQMTEG